MYFQIPLMILVIAPAIDGLRPEWREASANLGGEQLPLLALRRVPGAAALAPGRDDPALRQRLRRLRHRVRAHGRRREPRPADHRPEHRRRRALRIRTWARRWRFGMIVVIWLSMVPSTPCSSGAPRGGCDEAAALALARACGSCSARAYFLIPLAGDADLQPQSGTTGQCCSLSAYRGDPRRPGVLAARSEALVHARARDDRRRLLLLVPTVYWVHLSCRGCAPDRVPRAPAVRGAADHPRRRAARLLQGLRRSGSRAAARFLVAAYVILALPVHLLLARRGFPRDRRPHADRGVAEPRRDAGATTLFRVILPNIRARPRSAGRS